MKRSRGSATLIACLLVLPVAGCYQSAGKTVSQQLPSGNGTYLAVSDTLQVQNLIVVAGPQTGKPASVVLTLVNTGVAPEAITEVQVSGTAATLRPARIALPAGANVAIGGSSANQVQVAALGTPTGSYAPVVLKFERAGVVSTQALVVAPTGYYEPYAATSPAAPADAAKPAKPAS